MLKDWIIRKIRTATGTREILAFIRAQASHPQSAAGVPAATTPTGHDAASVARQYAELCRRVIDSAGDVASLGFAPSEAPLLVNVNDDLFWLPMDELKFIWHTYAADGDSIAPRFLIETPWYTWIRDRLAPGDQVIDCGANIGLFSLMMSRAVGAAGRVDAFEASPTVVDDLRRNLRINGATNVVANHLAVSDCEGTARFADLRLPDCRRESSHLAAPSEVEASASDYFHFVDVPTTTLDAYIRKHEIAPRLIKIDVEGAEFQVLEGAREYLQERRPLLVIEVHPGAFGEGDDHQPLWRFLSDHGYTFWQQDKIYYCEADEAQASSDTTGDGELIACRVNGVDLQAPRELLALYPHCRHEDDGERQVYYVETQQSDWLCARVGPGDAVLDVGASMGVIALALSRAVGERGAVHAFEPCRRSRHFLSATLAANDIENVVAAPFAVADAAGQAEFIEYSPENSFSWAPETSTLATGGPPNEHRCSRYHVDVTTIDEYVAQRGLEPAAIKIDIEGFEVYALQGARETLRRFRPLLCIDLHKDAKTGEHAGPRVEAILAEYGYEFTVNGHAIYAERRARAMAG